MDGVDLPERIGDYAVERELGAGGMGTVYLARSRGGRPVAVKVARPELAADPHFRAHVDFRCTTVDDQTVCGWGDDNTTVAVAFTPTRSLAEAAAETRKIRDDIRKPITQQP